MSNLKINLFFTGSQRSFSKTGLMWSWSRVQVTNLAAEFWILCNFWISLLGRPYKIPLQRARLETIWAWRSLTVVHFERKGWIVPILCKANDAALQIWFTWADNVKCSSSLTPRFRAESAGCITVLPNEMFTLSKVYLWSEGPQFYPHWVQRWIWKKVMIIYMFAIVGLRIWHKEYKYIDWHEFACVVKLLLDL